MFASLNDGERTDLLQTVATETGVSVTDLKLVLATDWRIVGRPKQQPPLEDDWTFWFIRAGRGFGKTLAAAQWIKHKALAQSRRRIALIAPTFADVRETMIEGETGLLSICEPRDLRGGSRESAWNRSTGELVFANGSRCKSFSSEIPDRLRGPQHHYAWCEEVSSWKDAKRGDALETTWSNVKLGLRLGDHPQAVITSTPKANKLTKELLAISAPTMTVVTGSSYENRENLSETWWETVVAPYEGTRLGRQEILAELLEDVEGALWTLAQIETLRVPLPAPPMERIVVAVDPNASSNATADNAGIIVVGRGMSTKWGYVLADHTVVKGGPSAWAAAAVDAYHEYEADRIIAEKNNGGEMVKLVIKGVDPSVPVKLVWASRGKRTRAEPIAAMYESIDAGPNRPARGATVRHAGVFPELEDEMTNWDGEGDSPDRMDALVWGLWELMVKRPTDRKATTSMPKGRIPGVGLGGQRQVQPRY